METGADPRAPSIHRVIEPTEMHEATGHAYPHTTHCLGSGEIMISTMGDPKGNAKGVFEHLLLDLQIDNDN